MSGNTPGLNLLEIKQCLYDSLWLDDGKCQPSKELQLLTARYTKKGIDIVPLVKFIFDRVAQTIEANNLEIETYYEGHPKP
jgi:hypothetical protein